MDLRPGIIRAEETLVNVGTIIGTIGTVISVVLVVVFLFGLLFFIGNISDDSKYNKIPYQQYLVNNPSYKMYINEVELTKYTTQKWSNPYVVKLVTPAKEYEVFVKDWHNVSLIGNQVVVTHNNITDVLEVLIRKNVQEIKNAQFAREKSFSNTKGYTWYWVKKLIFFIIVKLLFTESMVKWYFEKAYPYIKENIKKQAK